MLFVTVVTGNQLILFELPATSCFSREQACDGRTDGQAVCLPLYRSVVCRVCVDLPHGQGRTQGHAVDDIDHAVEATVSHGGDIDVVTAATVVVAAMTRGIVVGAVVSHHDVARVVTTMDMLTHSREVAANQPMRTAALSELTNRH